MTAENPLDVKSEVLSSPLAGRLVARASSALATRTSRRGFLARTALLGSALAVTPASYILKPGTAYAAICNCAGQACNCGAACCDGYTDFCCTLTGENTCPPGTAAGGWWKADAPGLCGSSPRYYLDCNVLPGASPCRCGCANGNCNNRKACCTQFRYGQCHQEVPVMGPIMCRVVTCMPPWEFDRTCTRVALTDNNTRFHDRPCLHDAESGRGPAITATSDSSLHVFARGTDRALWTRVYDPDSGWSGWNSMGGGMSSDADATTDGDDNVHVFARGDDRRLYWKLRSAGGQWSPWSPLGGGLASGPGACGNGDNRIEVFVRGNDNALWRLTFYGDRWSSWVRLGGILTSAIDPARSGTGDIHMFTRGGDRALWGRRLAPGGGWTDWYSLGGIVTSGPATAAAENGTLDVFAMGSNHAMWMRTYRGSWSGWLSLGGTFVSDPDAASYGNQTTVVARGTDGAIWRNTRTGLSWSGWFTLGRPA